MPKIGHVVTYLDLLFKKVYICFQNEFARYGIFIERTALIVCLSFVVMNKLIQLSFHYIPISFTSSAFRSNIGLLRC